MPDRDKQDEALSRESWRLFKILSEFVDGFEAMAAVGPGDQRVRLGADPAGAPRVRHGGDLRPPHCRA